VIAYIVRRLVAAVLLLFIVSAVTFSIFYLVPRWAGASPETLAARYVGRTATADTVHDQAVSLGFYDPIYVQYGKWAKAIFVGEDFNYGNGVEHCPAPCLGYSFRTKEPVLPEILLRVPVTVSLAIGASVIWVLFGVSAGVISALRRGTLFDRSAMILALTGVSAPIFFTGLLALSIFSYWLGWSAAGGSYTPFLTNPGLWAYDLILPWTVLAFQFSAGYARLTRAGMLETMNEDYVRTARAKGLPEGQVVVKHGLRGALTPIVTIFGLDIGLLLGGAILTESVFSLPGLGKFTIDAIGDNDLPKVMGAVVFATAFIVIANLIVDLVYGLIDPRVRIN
jgi:peptide/nickel transport system permease protein